VGTPPVPGTHRCNDKGGSILDRSPDFLRKSVEDNLQRLGLERMAIVPLRGFIDFLCRAARCRRSGKAALGACSLTRIVKNWRMLGSLERMPPNGCARRSGISA
jgi:hypothetical protein